MKYRITKSHDNLVITCTPEEQVMLQEMRDANPERFDTDDFMYDLLEKLTTDDCFQWIDARYTGDLTSAPMLAILGDEEYGPHEDCSGLWPCGKDGAGTRVQPILYRWAFMNYAVDTPQRDLLEEGICFWHGGEFTVREGQMGLAYSEREFRCRNFPLV